MGAKFPRRSFKGRPNPPREQHEVLRSAAAQLTAECEKLPQIFADNPRLTHAEAFQLGRVQEAATRVRCFLGKGADLV